MVNNLLTMEGRTKLKGSGDFPGPVDHFTSIILCLILCSSLVIYLLALKLYVQYNTLYMKLKYSYLAQYLPRQV